MKRRRLLVLLIVAIVAGASFAAWRHAPAVAARERPFTDLNTALAEGPRGWELHIAPRHPGPYRLRPEGPVLGLNPQSELICRVRDSAGTVLEEVKLKGNPAFDQTVVYFDTPDGRKTMAVLRRPR
jgi:hypothetical protein